MVFRLLEEAMLLPLDYRNVVEFFDCDSEPVLIDIRHLCVFEQTEECQANLIEIAKD